jgi:hypothetical protein
VNKHQSLLGFLLLLILPSLAFSFGQNKLTPHVDWSFLRGDQVDVYYYDGGYEQAVFTVAVADSACRELAKDYDWELPDGHRLVVVTYQSHNDFSNTTLTTGLVSESVGGFTEFFKNRVAVPFQGDWQAYRHVIHHELNHAYQLAMFYGESVLAGVIRFPLPLWFAEGTAEYTSRNGWDREANYFMADATVSGYLPDIPWLNGFLAYKGGQSLFAYIEESRGRAVFAELMHEVRSRRNINRAFEEVLGQDIMSLSADWKRAMREAYWPLVADRQRASDFSRTLTEHLQTRNFVNNSPAISPDGQNLVYLSDRSGTFDLYIMHLSAPENSRRLLQGEQSASFEELHWLRPGLSWAPDAKSIFFASKAGLRDALFHIDARTGKILRRYDFPFDGVFSPTVSPSGEQLAFIGLNKGQSDLYMIDLQDGSTVNLSSDLASDADPSFSPDGRFLLFTSDRDPKAPLGTTTAVASLQANHNLFALDLEAESSSTHRILALTATSHQVRTPHFWPIPPSRGASRSGMQSSSQLMEETASAVEQVQVAFICDAGGAFDLYTLPWETALAKARSEVLPESARRRTNCLTGIFQPSLSNEGDLVFTSFEMAGYDVHLLRDPHALGDFGALLEDDEERLAFRRSELQVASPLQTEERASKDLFAKMDFTEIVRSKSEARKAKKKVTKPLVSRDESGALKPHPYRLKFSPDQSSAQAQFNSVFGLQAASRIVFSDLLGNHHLDAYLNFYNRLEFSNVHLYYMNTAHRVQSQVGIFHYARQLSAEIPHRVYRDRLIGSDLRFAFPLSRYDRFEMNTRFTLVDRDSLNTREYELDAFNAPIYENYQQGRFLSTGFSFVRDNSLFGSTGPMKGERSRLTYTRGFPVSSGGDAGNDFHTFEADLRHYFRVNPDLTLALRVTAGASVGKTPQRFFLGGSQSWLNTKFFHANSDTTQNSLRSDINELYQAVFVQPLRGAALYHREGDRYALVNAEWRFPLLRQVIGGWPLGFQVYNLRGVLFADLGAAWDASDGFHARLPDGRLHDIMLGRGWGMRVNLGMMLLKLDWAWNTRLKGDTDGPEFILTLGSDF